MEIKEIVAGLEAAEDAMDKVAAITSIMCGLLLCGGGKTRARPIKNTTKQECYEALFAIQELLGTRERYYHGERIGRGRAPTAVEAMAFDEVWADGSERPKASWVWVKELEDFPRDVGSYRCSLCTAKKPPENTDTCPICGADMSK